MIDLLIRKGWCPNMDKAKLQSYRDWVRNELDVCANFWLKNGIDRVETGPQLETNIEIQKQWRKICTNLEQHKRRRCYAKHLDA